MNATDEVRFREFAVARAGALLHTAQLLTGDPVRAEKLLQQALGQAYLAWRRVEYDETADAFVRRSIAVRVAARQRIRWPLLRRRSIESTVDAAVDGEPELIDVLAQLPDRQRVALVLRYYEELSESEVADVLGIRLGTVQEEVQRAIYGIRDRMGKRAPLPHAMREELARAVRLLPVPSFTARELVLRGRRSQQRKRLFTTMTSAAVVVALCVAGSMINFSGQGGGLPNPTAAPRPIAMLPALGRVDYVNAGHVLYSQQREFSIDLPAGHEVISRIDRVSGGWLVSHRRPSAADAVRDFSFVDDNGARHDFTPSLAGGVAAIAPDGGRLAVLHGTKLSVIELPSLTMLSQHDAAGVRPDGLWLAGERVIAHSRPRGKDSDGAVTGAVLWDLTTGVRTVTPDLWVMDVSSDAAIALVYTETAEQSCLQVAQIAADLRPNLRVRCFSDKAIHPARFSPDGKWVAMPDPGRSGESGVKLRVYGVEGLHPTHYSSPLTVIYGEGTWTILGWADAGNVIVTPEFGRRGMQVLLCLVVSGQCSQLDLPADVIAVAVRGNLPA